MSRFISRKRHNWNEQCKGQGYSGVGFEKKNSSSEKDSFFYRSEIQVGLKTIISWLVREVIGVVVT